VVLTTGGGVVADHATPQRAAAALVLLPLLAGAVALARPARQVSAPAYFSGLASNPRLQDAAQK